MSSEAGVKHDKGKLPWRLVPWAQMKDVVQVLAFGAHKYPSADNWQRVEGAKERYLDAAFRHLLARAMGEQRDPETGLPHLAHLICCALFLAWFDDNKREA